jgi:hypothetical protein
MRGSPKWPGEHYDALSGTLKASKIRGVGCSFPELDEDEA